MPKTNKAGNGPQGSSNDFCKFTLRVHKASGRWTKKIRRRNFYFGYLKDDPTGETAWAEYLRVRDDLEAGITPAPIKDANGPPLKDLCNAFLRAKDDLVQSGDLSPRTFADYERACKFLTKHLGRERRVGTLVPRDFERLRAALAKRLGPSSVGHEINRMRIVFNYGVTADLLDKPVKFGDSFRRPKARVIRLERAKRGSMMIEADAIRAALDKAGAQMRVMILLGINCGLGNADVGRLRWRDVDLVGGWLDYPRPKTGVGRRAKLWPETVEGLVGLKKRKKKRDGDVDPPRPPGALVFRTCKGNSWAKEVADNPVAKEFRKVLIDAGHHRPGVGFYGLRRAFETVAGESKDQVAVDYVMGHAPQSDDMAAVYRQRISDQRLEAVAAVVHTWVFPPPESSQ